MDSEEYEAVRTDDLATVAYLRMKGHTPTQVQWDEDMSVCRWWFDKTAVSDATDFREDRALVNPRDFTKSFAIVKREMYRAQEKPAATT
jgi:hypothetical protein